MKKIDCTALKSIKYQLIFLLSVSAMVAIGLSTAAIFIYTYETNKIQSVKSSYILTSVLAENLQAPIVFEDKQGAENILNSLKSDSSVNGAYIFNNDQSLFAQYLKQDVDSALVSQKVNEIIQINGINQPIEYINTGLIITSSPVYAQGKPIANLVIASDTERLNEIIKEQLTTMLSVAFLVLIFIVLWAMRLQKRFTNPILNLKTKMDVVTQQHDFSITISEKRQDEFQSLFDGFNIMIATINQQTNELNIAKQKIEESHQHTRSSIEYSSIIQLSILPNKESFPSVFPDSFAHWQPKDIVGGDIWFFDPIKRAGEYLLFVIDCTGHGVPGAFVTMLVKSIQRSIMMECRITKKEIHPGKLLAIFNNEIKSLLDQHTRESESNAGFDGGIVYFDLNRRGIIRYAGAETPLFLLDKEGKCKTIKGSRHSVGYRSCDEDYVYEEHEFSIADFDRLYLTTDGLLDQNGGAKDIPFGKRKLVSLLEAHHNKPITDIKELVMNDLAQWKGNAEQNDDITFVGIKFNEIISPMFQLDDLYMKELNNLCMENRRNSEDHQDKSIGVEEVKALVAKDGIVFLIYGGFLSQTIITSFADAIEKETLEHNVGIGDSSNILTVFIELAQNILNYGKSKELGSVETKAEGLIIVGKSSHEKEQQQYYIVSQNVVATTDKDKMIPKFEDILSLDKEGLKKRYRELRKSGKDTHEKGGGIGFYEIAKRSDHIEYEFTELNEEKLTFEFKAFVNIKPTTTSE